MANNAIVRRVTVLISYHTHHPEFEKILKDRRCDEYAVEYGVREEEQEELVVGEAHTVVHPETKTVTNIKQIKDEIAFNERKKNPANDILPGTVVVHL